MGTSEECSGRGHKRREDVPSPTSERKHKGPRASNASSTEKGPNTVPTPAELWEARARAVMSALLGDAVGDIPDAFYAKLAARFVSVNHRRGKVEEEEEEDVENHGTPPPEPDLDRLAEAYAVVADRLGFWPRVLLSSPLEQLRVLLELYDFLLYDLNRTGDGTRPYRPHSFFPLRSAKHGVKVFLHLDVQSPQTAVLSGLKEYLPHIESAVQRAKRVRPGAPDLSVYTNLLFVANYGDKLSPRNDATVRLCDAFHAGWRCAEDRDDVPSLSYWRLVPPDNGALYHLMERVTSLRSPVPYYAVYLADFPFLGSVTALEYPKPSAERVEQLLVRLPLPSHSPDEVPAVWVTGMVDSELWDSWAGHRDVLDSVELTFMPGGRFTASHPRVCLVAVEIVLRFEQGRDLPRIECVDPSFASAAFVEQVQDVRSRLLAAYDDRSSSSVTAEVVLPRAGRYHRSALPPLKLFVEIDVIGVCDAAALGTIRRSYLQSVPSEQPGGYSAPAPHATTVIQPAPAADPGRVLQVSDALERTAIFFPTSVPNPVHGGASYEHCGVPRSVLGYTTIEIVPGACHGSAVCLGALLRNGADMAYLPVVDHFNPAQRDSVARIEYV